jgi:hypothetical protein
MRSLAFQLLVFCLFSGKISAQVGYQIVSGGKSAAMSNAVLAIPSAEVVFQNPASLMFLTRQTAIISTEMRLGVTQLRPIGVGFIQPTKSGVFGFSFQHFGFSAFQQQKLGVALARRFSDKLDVGIQLDYLHLQAPDYGNAHLLTFEIGCNTRLSNDIVLATYVYNPLNIAISGDERIPSVFRLGVGYSVNSKVIVAAEIEKSVIDAASFRFGFDYKIAETVSARFGFSSLPVRFSLGFGYALNEHFVIDVALSQQALLGSTPAVSLVYGFGKEKKELKE